MNDGDKTKEQLMSEIEEVRQQVAVLGTSEAEHRQAEREAKWFSSSNNTQPPWRRLQIHQSYVDPIPLIHHFAR